MGVHKKKLSKWRVSVTAALVVTLVASYWFVTESPASAACSIESYHTAAVAVAEGEMASDLSAHHIDYASRGMYRSGGHYSGDRDIAEQHGWIWNEATCLFEPPAPPTSTTAPATTTPVAAPRSGYWMLERDGTIYGFGDSPTYAAVSLASGASAVSFDRSAAGDALWVLDDRGWVHVRGNANYYGDVDLNSLALGDRVASISITPTGHGYWVFTDLGRVLTFGDAIHYSDLPSLGITPNGLIVASAPTPTGKGYYLLGSDGGVFAFGDATFYGSIPGVLPPGALACPIVGLVPAPSGLGYWMVACDGGVFAFGAAPFRGSIPGVLSAGTKLNSPINGLVPYGDGYLMVGADGGVFSFSDLGFLGSLGGNPPDTGIIAITAFAT